LVEQRQKQTAGSSRVEFAVTPRFAGSCTKELMAGLGRLAREHGAIVQSHLSETQAECELISRLHGGPNYTSIYQQAGLLMPRTLLGHGIWLDDAERAILRESGAIIAHCPTANIFLQSGAMDRQAHQKADVRLALGSDIGAGYERSMIRVARTMINTAKSIGHPFPSAAECWHQITAGNADAIGWSAVGRLTPGAEADVLLLKPDVPWQTADDPLAKLLYSWDDRWLRLTIIKGVGHPARREGQTM
jgi:guanine deaminase